MKVALRRQPYIWRGCSPGCIGDQGWDAGERKHLGWLCAGLPESWHLFGRKWKLPGLLIDYKSEAKVWHGECLGQQLALWIRYQEWWDLESWRRRQSWRWKCPSGGLDQRSKWVGLELFCQGGICAGGGNEYVVVGKPSLVLIFLKRHTADGSMKGWLKGWRQVWQVKWEGSSSRLLRLSGLTWNHDSKNQN